MLMHLLGSPYKELGISPDISFWVGGDFALTNLCYANHIPYSETSSYILALRSQEQKCSFLLLCALPRYCLFG